MESNCRQIRVTNSVVAAIFELDLFVIDILSERERIRLPNASISCSNSFSRFLVLVEVAEARQSDRQDDTVGGGVLSRLLASS